jgi:hypothetical protein
VSDIQLPLHLDAVQGKSKISPSGTSARKEILEIRNRDDSSGGSHNRMIKFQTGRRWRDVKASPLEIIRFRSSVPTPLGSSWRLPVISTSSNQKSSGVSRPLAYIGALAILWAIATLWPTAAQGGFVVSLGLNLPVTTNTTADINFGGAAATPFRFQGFCTDSGTHGIRMVDANSGLFSPNLVRFNLGQNKVERLDFADLVGDGNHFLGSSRLLHGLDEGDINLEGDWALGRPLQNLSGYIGVRFTASGNPANVHYGWIRYTATSTSTSSPFSTGVINGWGYNTTPGESILAGVPEPSGLVLLGGLAASFGTWSRRRRLA